MAFCPNCGNQVDDGAKFCQGCGNPLDGSAPAPAQEQSQGLFGDIKKTGLGFKKKMDNYAHGEHINYEKPEGALYFINGGIVSIYFIIITILTSFLFIKRCNKLKFLKSLQKKMSK